MTIKIINIRNTKPIQSNDIYIDRRSPLGNPFYMKNELLRDHVCNQYEIWFNEQRQYQPKFIAELNRLKSIYQQYGEIRLFCWCAPKRCHGKTIKKWLIWQLKGGEL